MRIIRPLLLLAAAAALLLASADPAWAQKRNRQSGPKSQVELTGYQSFDSVFRKARQMDQRLVSAERLLNGSRKDLNSALGIRRNAPIQSALADLKKMGGQNLQVVMNGNVPQLKPRDVMPKNLQNATDAVNRMTSGIMGSIEDLIAIPGEAKGLIKRSQAFPERFKDEINHDLFGMIFKAPKTLKTIHRNVKVVTALPDRSIQVVNQMNQIVTTLTSEFAPGALGRGGAADTDRSSGRTRGGGQDSPATRTRSR